MLTSVNNSESLPETAPNTAAEQFLEQVFSELPHIAGVFLFTAEGKVTAHAEVENVNLSELQKLVAEILRLAQRTSGVFAAGKLNCLALLCQFGQIATTRLATGHDLVVLGRREVSPGVVLYDLEQLADRLVSQLKL